MSDATFSDPEIDEKYDGDTDVLVSPEWLEEHLDEVRSDDPDYRLVEADIEYDESYAEGHIPGAVGFRWGTHLQDSVERDILKRAEFEEIMGDAGITEDTTVILYGDESNQWAAYTYWQFKYYGHDDVKLLDGGRTYWFENDYPTTDEEPDVTAREYESAGPEEDLRAYLERVEEVAAIESESSAEGRAEVGDDPEIPLVDVRSEAEYRGEKVAPEGSKETARRAGHIPGATNISWKENLDDEGRFKGGDDLHSVYADRGIEGDTEVITYCRIGERSSITWFTLHELLGWDTTNYDGSWTEWGNLVRQPVAVEVDDPASADAKE
ncbi:sulfurtransferase [Natronococcus sp. JC468]|uniref:sulfurtransferase n=1 Tax=Natronococcus sp. JC468 TaxID=1961921 RepID=UPI00143AE778|nr:sulfurtransferase [Natronococcus sp. JC468]NKE37847.1 sulfurtransferase [Natronococcus sp. JC468]